MKEDMLSTNRTRTPTLAPVIHYEAVEEGGKELQNFMLAVKGGVVGWNYLCSSSGRRGGLELFV